MSISGVLWRFLAAYIVLMVVVVVAFQLLGVSSNSGVNVGILIGAVLWPCMAFGTRNKRYFTAPEKKKVMWGMIGINLALQGLVGGAALAAEGKLNLGALVIGLLVVGVLHSLAIAYFVRLGGKLFEKQLQNQLQKQAATGE
ncbi:ABZJ_00895 family protein [Polaromonas sp. YR568]|uniref:ABZJ_00895 family protein n=1 Tax=Polaromonas sp. YR568 TaxID=1855301 RepID=UPI00398C20FC